jgi:hypothetical protein
MNLIVVIVGWIVIGVSLFGIASPHSLIDIVLGWSPVGRFCFAIVPRIVLGVLFLWAAPRCRLPWLIYAIGAIMLIAGGVLFFLGSGRVEDLVHWMAARSELWMRSIYVVATLLAALLVYAGSKPKAIREKSA